MFIMVGGSGKNARMRTCAAAVKGAVKNCNSWGGRTGGSGDDVYGGLCLAAELQ